MSQIEMLEQTIKQLSPSELAAFRSWFVKFDAVDDWERIRDAYLHTLGNLTLTGYNSEYGDRTFPEKRDMHSDHQR